MAKKGPKKDAPPEDAGRVTEAVDADGAELLDRDLSWLDFNARVLALAEDPSVPLLERLKFLAIFSGNLDEFFMVRVAGLAGRVAAGLGAAAPGGPRPAAPPQTTPAPGPGPVAPPTPPLPHPAPPPPPPG